MPDRQQTVTSQQAAVCRSAKQSQSVISLAVRNPLDCECSGGARAR